MRLGQKVSFTKSLSQQRGISVNYNLLTDEQVEKLEGGGTIKDARFKERNHNRKIGFIAGKRSITTSLNLISVDTPIGRSELVPTDQKTEDVFVVACDMQRLFRVRLEDLEVIT